MTKSTITRERLEELAAGQSGFNLRTATHEESQELARMALAAMDSEPVAEVVSIYGDPEAFGAREIRPLVGIQQMPYGTKLYRHAQPAPVVPDAYVRDESGRMMLNGVCEPKIGFGTDWNACRAAMLKAQPQNAPQNIPEIIPGWIPVSERMPDREVDVQVYCPDKKEQMVAYLERNELDGYFRFATWRTGEGIYCQPTHWMQLPAGPREVKGE